MLCVMAVEVYKYDRDIWNVPEDDVVAQRKVLNHKFSMVFAIAY